MAGNDKFEHIGRLNLRRVEIVNKGFLKLLEKLACVKDVFVFRNSEKGSQLGKSFCRLKHMLFTEFSLQDVRKIKRSLK